MAKIKDYVDLFALDGYWRGKRAEKKKIYTDKSMRTRDANMRNWIIPLWGDIDPRKLTVKIIDDSMTGITSGFTRRALAGQTRNRILSVLSDLYAHLLSEGLVKYNPVRDVIKCPQAPENPRNALPLGEIRKLFPAGHDELKAVWRTQKYICAFLILKDTGLRPGELLALKWGDWDPQIKFFPILRAIESGTRDKEKGTKTGDTKPAIITDQTAGEIETLRRKIKPKPEEYLFANKHGVPYDTHRLCWNFHRAVERAGINRPELTPCFLRHTFNTRMLETHRQDLVQHLTGHATEAMVRRYRHADAESLARTAAKIRAEAIEGRLY
jgi:integrase